MNTFSRLLLTLALAGSLLLIGGCGPKPIAPYAPGANTNMPEGKNFDYQTKGTITEEGLTEEGLDASGRDGESYGSFTLNSDQNSDEYKRTHGRSSAEMQPVYFQFDSSTIGDDQIPRLEHNAAYLQSNPNNNLLIEGNCDDRGTNEYNLALGERRAQVAKNYLIQLGIDGGRLRTVSYGEESPLFTNQNEDDYALNRRDDFILE
jgi:peptidoglycan-associated lipoprotein